MIFRNACKSVVPLFIAAFTSVNLFASELEEAWDARNDPSRLASNYSVNFSSLPATGQTAVIPWGGYYWPNNKGGLAYRWAMGGYANTGFSYPLLDQSTLQSMSQQELAQLSPAEKYDILRGDMNYTLTQYERSRSSPSAPRWFGLCDGWAASTLNFNEPQAVTMQSPHGITVPFGSSDIKALLALAETKNGGASSVLGMRCNQRVGGWWGGGMHSRECRDVNAGAFHIILTNYVGLMRRPFIYDESTGDEVWNFPIYAYRTEVLGDAPPYANVAPGTARVLAMRTTIYHNRGHRPSWQPVGSAGASQKVYTYAVELDHRGNIIGGEWLQRERPDFLWVKGPPQFTGIFAELQNLVQASSSR